MILPTWLTHKGIPWNFTDATQKSFQALKSAFTSTPVLTHWVPNKPIIVETDASNEDLAMLFVMHVFSKHSVPEHVTSDHSPEFVSHFFHSLGKALDMKLHFTSSYYL